MLIYNFKFSNFWLQLKFYLDSRGCAPSYFSHLSFLSFSISLPAGHINLLSVHQICGAHPPPRVCCALSWNSIHQIKHRFSVACRAQLTSRQACCNGSVGSSLPTSIASECFCLKGFSSSEIILFTHLIIDCQYHKSNCCFYSQN